MNYDERNKANEDYFQVFGYYPDATSGYVKPTTAELQACIESKTEFDFYKDMPSDVVV